MAVAPDTPSALKSKGNDELKAGRHLAAVELYSKALEIDAIDPAEAAAIHANRALANLKLGHNKECVADCDAAISREPRYGKAFYRRAQAREALEQLGDAFKDVHEVLRLEPANKEAQAYAVKLKRAMEMRAQLGDLSTPTLAVEKLLNPKATDEDKVQAVGKLSRCAEDKSRALELLHAGAVPPLLALLPAPADVTDAASLQMPLVGLSLIHI